MISKKTAKITIGGKERTFYFGLGFLGLFIENTPSTLESLETDIKNNPFKVLPELMFYSLSYGYVRQGLEADFNRYVVSDWIDDEGGVDSEAVKTFMECLGNSMKTDLPQEKGQRAKKKLVKKQL